MLACFFVLAGCDNYAKKAHTPLREIVLFNTITNSKFVTIVGVCEVDAYSPVYADIYVYTIICINKDFKKINTTVEKSKNTQLVITYIAEQPSQIPAPIIQYSEFKK